MSLELLPMLLANGETLSPEGVVLLVVFLLFLFTTFYLSIVTIPELRQQLQNKSDESVASGKSYELERQGSSQKFQLLDREHNTLLAKLEDPETATNVTRQLKLARLDNHVLRRTKERVECERHRENRNAQSRANELAIQLRHAALDRHVKTRTQQRLEQNAKTERTTFVECQSQSTAKIRQQVESIVSSRCRLKRNSLDLHVKSRLIERLEDSTRDQVRQIEELSDQVHSIKSRVRSQSQQAVAQKLQQAELEIAGLRLLQQRMQSTEASTSDCLDSLATIGDSAKLRNGNVRG